MSRSFKKPYIKDHAPKAVKRDAKRAVRNADEVADGNHYKKHYESWNLCDYKWEERKPLPNEKPRRPLDRTYEEKLRIYNKARRK